MEPQMTSHQSTSRRERDLHLALLLYATCFVAHNADHARRGVAASPEPVVWAGTAVAMMSAALATLILTKHRLAPVASFVGGTTIAIGVSLTHYLPKWGVLSDPVLTSWADSWTRVAVSLEITGAALLAVTALSVVRSRGWSGRAGSSKRTY